MTPVDVASRGHVGVVTFSRPAVRNALSRALVEALDHALRSLSASAPVRAVVITGGPHVFSAGADLKERSGLPPAAWRENHLAFESLARTLQGLPQPTIAAVHGWALGGGCELAMGTDIIVAAPDARFGQPEALRGLIPGMGGPQLLSRRLPPGLARHLLYTGAVLGAEEAARWGMVTFIDDDPIGRAVAIGQQIAKASPAAVRAIKRLVSRPGGFEQTYATELQAWHEVVATGDAAIGAQAFADKRTPTYPDA